jgi:HEAT repeat protein
MKRYKLIPIFLLTAYMAATSISYAQPKIPKEKIPPGIPSDVRKQIEKLYSQNTLERGLAVYEIGGMKRHAVSAIPFLAGMLEDDAKLQWEMQYNIVDRSTSTGEEAARALAKINRRAVEILVENLKNKNSFVKDNVAIALGEVARDPRAIEVLISIIKNVDMEYQYSPWNDVKIKAISALGKIDDPRVVEFLITVLNDNDSSIRSRVIFALGKKKDRHTIECLLVALKDENPHVRAAAADTLGRIKNPVAVLPLISVIKDKNSEVRINVVSALGEMKDPRSVELLISSFKDENADVRIRAIQILSGWADKWQSEPIKDFRVVSPLIIILLRDKDPEVRLNAACALGKIENRLAILPLIIALKDKESNVRKWALSALVELTQQDFGQDPVKWREWWEKNRDRIYKER